jgi:hypothetical protein
MKHNFNDGDGDFTVIFDSDGDFLDQNNFNTHTAIECSSLLKHSLDERWYDKVLYDWKCVPSFVHLVLEQN